MAKLQQQALALERIYCEGELLHAVQTSNIFDDCKYFVDMSLKFEPLIVLEKFSALCSKHGPSMPPEIIREFVGSNFNPPGDELEKYQPLESSENEAGKALLLSKIHDDELRWFGAELINLWPILFRQVSSDVRDNPTRYSLLHRLHPLVIPGGRFRETYYWDSYFIVKGLLVSGMVEMSKGMVENLLDDVKKYGFVPNGSRIYYLNRSQPPLLSEMVMSVFKHTGDINWLYEIVGILENEYDYWMSGEKVVRIAKSETMGVSSLSDNFWLLNRYHVRSDRPRPESYREDINTASSNKRNIYQELATAAESGWDFSSRWTAQSTQSNNEAESNSKKTKVSPEGDDTFNLANISPTQWVPIDLNAILFRMENNISQIHKILSGRLDIKECELKQSEHLETSRKFQKFATRRKESIENVLWDNGLGRWRDAWLNEPLSGNGGSVCIFSVAKSPNRLPYLSDFAVTLWAGLADGDSARQSRVVSSLLTSGLLREFGVSTSIVESKEQWDFPNMWPPLIDMLVEGLERCNGDTSVSITLKTDVLARHIAQQYISTAFNHYVGTDDGASDKGSLFMCEKYDAEFSGGGGGGEYIPQIGFGWSNGVALVLLQKYGGDLKSRVLSQCNLSDVLGNGNV